MHTFPPIGNDGVIPGDICSTGTPTSKARKSVEISNYLNIGDVSLPIIRGSHPEKVACGLPPIASIFFNPRHPETLGYLRWIAQKELLNQDICIIGDPGPTKRWLAMMYAQIAQREVQFMSLSRDTTEADIKQRKEIRNGTLLYVNQPAVTASLEGQMLIIDGLERAERNVLPVINNLLENREMHLDNGMVLIHPQRYDQLCKDHHTNDLTPLGLLRVSEHFRVVGLTVPVPKFSGNPLDPPLRSRFQCLFLHPALSQSKGYNGNGSGKEGATSGPFSSSMRMIPKSIQGTTAAERMLKFRTVQNYVDDAGSDRDRIRSVPCMTDFELFQWASQHAKFPNEDIGEVLHRVYPWELFLRMGPNSELNSKRESMLRILKKYSLLSLDSTLKIDSICFETDTEYNDDAIVGKTTKPQKRVTIKFSDGSVAKRVPAGNLLLHNIEELSNSHPLFGHGSPATTAFFMPSHRRVIQGMIQSHVYGRHIALCGSTGCGKTILVREFASLFGYEVETQHMYSDMSTRDLLQRRCTDPKTGNTTWELSSLMQAAKDGKLAVLDGIDYLTPGSLAVLQELLLDGNITLFDGTVFKNCAAFDAMKKEFGLESDEEMSAMGVYRIHPSFILIATCRYPTPDSVAKKTWLSSDLLPLFNWHVLPDLSSEACAKVLSVSTERFAVTYTKGSERDTDFCNVNLRAVTCTTAVLTARQQSKEFQAVIAKLVKLQQHLAEMAKTESKSPTLTLRQLIHISKHTLIFPDDLEGIIESTLLVPLLSQLLGSQIRQLMVDVGLAQKRSSSGEKSASSSLTTFFGKAVMKMFGNSDGEEGTNTALIRQDNLSDDQKSAPFCVVHQGHSKAILSYGAEILRISRRFSLKETAFIPFVPNFNPNCEQQLLQTWIAKNIASGNNVLIVGNQGVGKNKVVDQFLMESGLPRHYLQLHRDTTVSSLTINPTVVDGKVIWEDSPLVKATQNGHILVVDEIDKAPVEVVHILKGLIEDREMKLGDGRKISGWPNDIEGRDPGEVIPIHRDFRIIVLANPPGFPFHGNDFYRECGDLFSCYVMQNPDPMSQIDILRNIAPQMPPVIITQLVKVFSDLGELFKAGILQYPFSLRELIAIVKHLNKFPQDGVYQSLNNVFNFDLLDANTMSHVQRLLHEHLSTISDHQLTSTQLPNHVAQEIQLGKLEKMATFSISVGDDKGENKTAKGRVKSVVSFVEHHRCGEKTIPIPIDVIVDDTPARHSVTVTDMQVKNNSKTLNSKKRGTKKILENEAEVENELFTESLGAIDLSHVLDASQQEVIIAVKMLPAGSATNLVSSVTVVLTSRGRLMLFNTSAMHRKIEGRQLHPAVACLDLPQHIKFEGKVNWEILGASSLLTNSINMGYRDISEVSTLIDDEPEDCDPHIHLLNPISGTILAIPIESCLIRVKDAEDSPVHSVDGLVSMVSSIPSIVNGTSSANTIPKSSDVKVYQFIPNKREKGKSAAPLVVASHLAAEGFVSCNFLNCVKMLYYGRSVELSFFPDGDSSTSYTILKFEPFSSQLAFVALVVNEHIQLGFVKITAFHNSVVAAFNPITLADVPRPEYAKDKRRRFTKNETMKLLLSDGSFAGFGREEGYVPSIGQLSEENLRDALFVMSPSSFQSADEKQAHSTLTTDAPVVVKKGDVLYALAAVEQISDTELLMTLTGFVNTVSDNLQLSGNINSSKAMSFLGATDLEVSNSITTVSYTSPWQKVGETSMRSYGELGSAGLHSTTTSSVTTHYAHQQLAAVSYRNPNDSNNPLAHVISTHKATIRTFDPAGSVHGSLSSKSSVANTEVSKSVSDTIQTISSGDKMPSVPYSLMKSTIDISADGYGTSVNNSGTSISYFDANSERRKETYSRWSSVLKSGGALGEPPIPDDLSMSYSKPRKSPNADNLKRGEEDPDNNPHVGGNNWAGGSGGTDTAGLGGLVGPYRLDKGHPVTQVDPEEKKKVPKHIIEEAKKMGQEALKKRLDEINMSVNDDKRYRACFERVQGSIQQLRSMLQGIKNKETERSWIRHQTDGVWDDSKIVEGITGEKTVYKRRAESDTSSLFGKPQTEENKKRLLFVLDVSASMYRFNGMDGRLNRLVECAVMIMESFRGHEDKIDYAIVGHSGDSSELPLVDFGRPPTNNKERMDVALRMVAYSQHCWSGDNTVEAMQKSVGTVRKRKAENYFVFVISDANLAQYGISPVELSHIIKSDELVQMFCIFIASFGQQAKQIQRHLPPGHGFECLDAAELPMVLKQIFTATDILS